MNVVELISRTDVILSKYEKYIPENAALKAKGKGQGAFEDAYVEIIDQINSMNLKADETGNELNRAVKAALNAELRKSKAALLEVSLPKLEKLVKKGKGLNKDIIEDRLQKVQQVKEGIAGIPDGVTANRKPRKPMAILDGKGKGKRELTLSGEMDPRTQNPGYYQQTEVAVRFRQEFEQAKVRQDKALDSIEKGLVQLKGIGEAMGENLNQQDVLLAEIDQKMDSANKGLKTNNMKLKGLVTKMRSGKTFCIDVALICILLAMGLWIYNLFKK